MSHLLYIILFIIKLRADLFRNESAKWNCNNNELLLTGIEYCKKICYLHHSK